MLKRLVIGASLCGLVGCGATVWWGNKSAALSFGMSKRQVQQMLGPPQSIMSQQINGMMIESWKYLDRTLTFQNGVLQSWGTTGDMSRSGQ